MKPHIWFVVLLTASFVGIVPLAHAEILQGNVVFVNFQGNLFKMLAKDPLTGEEKSLQIVVTRDTQFDGVSSVLELKLGDEVSVKARSTKDEKIWKATSVNVDLS